MGFSRQGYWSGLPCPPSGDLADPGIEPASLMTPALAVQFFTATTSDTWEPIYIYMYVCMYVCMYRCIWHRAGLVGVLLQLPIFFFADGANSLKPVSWACVPTSPPSWLKSSTGVQSEQAASPVWRCRVGVGESNHRVCG